MAEFVAQRLLTLNELMQVFDRCKHACDVSFSATVRIEYEQPVEDVREAQRMDAQYSGRRRFKPGEKVWYKPAAVRVQSGQELYDAINTWHCNTHVLPPGNNHLSALRVRVDEQVIRAERRWLRKTGKTVLYLRIIDTFNGHERYDGVLCATDRYNLFIEINGDGQAAHVDEVLGVNLAPARPHLPAVRPA